MSGSGPGRQQIADLDGAEICVRFAVDFPSKRDRLPILGVIPLVQHDAWLELAGTGDDTRDFAVVGKAALFQRSPRANDQYCSGSDADGIENIEMLGAVGAFKNKIAT